MTAKWSRKAPTTSTHEISKTAAYRVDPNAQTCSRLTPGKENCKNGNKEGTHH